MLRKEDTPIQVLRNPAVSGAASEHGVACVATIDYQGKRLVATGTTDGVLRVLDGATGKSWFHEQARDRAEDDASVPTPPRLLCRVPLGAYLSAGNSLQISPGTPVGSSRP